MSSRLTFNVSSNGEILHEVTNDKFGVRIGAVTNLMIIS